MAIRGYYIANPNNELLWMEEIRPTNIVNMPLFARFHTCQLMQDFFHQQYEAQIPQNDHTFALFAPPKYGPHCMTPLAQGSRLLTLWSFGTLAVVQSEPSSTHTHCHSLLLANQQKFQNIGGFIAAHPTGQIHREIRVDLRFREFFAERKFGTDLFFWGKFYGQDFTASL